MAYNKLQRKDFVIAIKTGDDSTATTLAQLKFAKEAVKGELYFNTATAEHTHRNYSSPLLMLAQA